MKSNLSPALLNSDSGRRIHRETAQPWIERIAPRFHRYWSGATWPGWIEPPRRIFDHELVLVTRGRCLIRIEGQDEILDAPSYIVISPGQLHTTFQQGRHLFRMCFHFDWVPNALPPPVGYCVYHPARVTRRQLHLPPAFLPRRRLRGPLTDLATLSTLAAQIQERQSSPDPILRLTCNALLLEILYRIFGRTQSDLPAPRLTQATRLAHQVRGLLQKLPSQKESIQMTLETLGFSYAHLCRVFRRQYGVTPVEYLNALRIEQAKELLAAGNESILDIARKSGFNHAQYFSRMFRRQTGQSPRDYRALDRSG